MKKRLLIIASALLVLGLASAIFAVTQTNALSFITGNSAHSCCSKKDSCPMKDHAGMAKKDGASCCDNCACCKGDGKAMNHGENCCENCGCCGDSCPMKKKDGKTTAEATAVTAEGDGCCCDCCKKAA